MTRATSDDQVAEDLLAEVFGMYKHVPTMLESELWLRLIEVHGGKAICAVLRDHCLKSNFAPKPSDVQKMLTTQDSDANSALELVLREVRVCGPYQNPNISDPVIVKAVLLMGGWANMNSTMPSPESRYEFDGFRKRWEGCYNAAANEQKRQNLIGIEPSEQPRLLGLVEQHFVDKSAQVLLLRGGA